jgi:hypothetical protein
MIDSQNDDDPKYDRKISNEEYIESVANRFKLRCTFCGSADWSNASYDFENICIDACSECHVFDDYGVVKPIRHS